MRKHRKKIRSSQASFSINSGDCIVNTGLAGDSPVSKIGPMKSFGSMAGEAKYKQTIFLDTDQPKQNKPMQRNM